MAGTGPAYSEFIVLLLDRLRWAGIKVLDDMEDAGIISCDERRKLQYEYVSGINKAHFTMEDMDSKIAEVERAQRKKGFVSKGR